MSYFELVSDCIAGIPSLVLSPSAGDTVPPLVLLLHGLGSHKEKMLPILYGFAQSGFRAVAIDLRQHGERADAPGRDSRLETSYIQTMFDIITGSASDVSTVLDHLDVVKAGLHGLSLGGYVGFAALVGEQRLGAAAIAMGSPDWLGPLHEMGIDTTLPIFAPLVAANPLDRAALSYSPRPLLMLHGAEDEVVSPVGVRALHDRLRPSYNHVQDRLQLLVYPNLGHHYTEDMQQRSVDWLTLYQ